MLAMILALPLVAVARLAFTHDDSGCQGYSGSMIESLVFQHTHQANAVT